MCLRLVIKRGMVVVCEVHLRHVAIVLVFRQRVDPRGSGVREFFVVRFPEEKMKTKGGGLADTVFQPLRWKRRAAVTNG